MAQMHPIEFGLININRLFFPLIISLSLDKERGPAMVSSTLLPLSFTNFTLSAKHNNLRNNIPCGCDKKFVSRSSSSCSSASSSPFNVLRNSIIPLAASAAILLYSNPAKAGFLSGFSGIESVPGPELPQFDFLNRFNEENQKKYAENDARFKESPLLKKLLEKSKLNKAKNRLEIENKYCLRGAEWGVGDCSAEGMSVEDREKFIEMLKQKAGVNE
ncbi:uncharacterized protein LOC123217199 [Mangifera indica]|uniref:uncharacterized protein LOC123217199 n=1 Tax=Mangifera indica TaxID=29780 RepID=UPI001CFB8AA1|nr:uncharacterized protein LOC123217199 [Mangifera indica]